jgi:tetratricopeptide (TPR) repeat protein/predicted small lipoprotein YifL
MKKVILGLLAVSAIFGVAACSRSGPSDSQPPAARSASNVSSQSTSNGVQPPSVTTPGGVQVASARGANSGPAAPVEEEAPPLPKHLVSSEARVDKIQALILDEIWAQSDVWFHHGDYERSVADMRLVTAAEPEFVEGYCSGGNLLESLGRHKDAEAYFQQGVAANPESSKMAYALGMFYFNFMKDYPAAIAVYEKDIKIKNADVNDWKMLAHAYEKMDKMDKAVDTWKKIYARWPNGPGVKSNYDRIMRQAGAAKP